MGDNVDQHMPRDAETFNDFVAAQLRSHGARLDEIEPLAREAVEIIRLGKGFFIVLGYLGKGFRWSAGILLTALAAYQAVIHFFNGPPPPPAGQ